MKRISSKADQDGAHGVKLWPAAKLIQQWLMCKVLPLWSTFYSHPPIACLFAPPEQHLLFLPEQRETCWAKKRHMRSWPALWPPPAICAHENVWWGIFFPWFLFSFNNNVFFIYFIQFVDVFFFSNRNYHICMFNNLRKWTNKWPQVKISTI